MSAPDPSVTSGSERRPGREGEVERIRRAYDGYAVSARVRRRRDPRNLGSLAIVAERTALFEGMLRTQFGESLHDCRVLDVGCGEGGLLAWLQELGVPAENLYGVDLLPDRIRAARSLHPHLDFRVASAESLDHADGSFQLVTCWTVFSSILDDAMAAAVAGEIDRVLRSGGAVGWYDFRYPNPWNPNTRPMTRPRITSLFPGYVQRLTTATVLPPLARGLRRLAPAAYGPLRRLRPLRSHYLGLLVKRA